MAPAIVGDGWAGLERWRRGFAWVLGGALFVWLASQSRPLYTTPMCLIYDNPALKAGRK